MAAIPYNPNAFASPAAGTGAYNYTPAPQSGSGVFGAVPGVVTPPNPFQSLAGVYPQLQQTNSALSGDVMSNLMGGISPNTIAAIHDAGSKFGVTSPINVSPLSLGETDTQLQDLGVSQFGKASSTVSGTQTLPPSLQAQLSMWNAHNAASPNPSDAGTANEIGSVLGLIAALAI